MNILELIAELQKIADNQALDLDVFYMDNNVNNGKREIRFVCTVSESEVWITN